MAKAVSKAASKKPATKKKATEETAAVAPKKKPKSARSKKKAAKEAVKDGVPLGLAPSKPTSTSALLGAAYRKSLIRIDKHLGMTSGTGTQLDPIHTGSLTQDYICGGGARPGLFVAQGMEASGKSTSCVHMTDQAAHIGIPFRTYYDPEGAIGLDFIQYVLRHRDASSLFGEDVPYYQETILEDVMNHIAMTVAMFPVKDYSEDLGSWVYKVPKDKKDVAAMTTLANMRDAGLKPDEAAGKGEVFHVIPTDYKGPEAYLALDSWASLVPRKKKGAPDEGGGMSLAARLFSELIPTFGADLKQRGIILWSVNQLRTKPGVMYGDPLYMKSDGTLKFYITCTNRMMPRAVPQGLDKDKESGQLGAEPSVYGDGVDRYSYKGVSNLKNKWGRPFLKGMVRIWVSDHKGHMRGIDPVWDTMEYLRMTGQQDGGNKLLKFMPRASAPAGLKELAANKKIPYMDFKRLVLAEHTGDKELLSTAMKVLKLSKPPKLRDGLYLQMQKDATLWGGGKAPKSEDQEDDDDE